MKTLAILQILYLATLSVAKGAFHKSYQPVQFNPRQKPDARRTNSSSIEARDFFDLSSKTLIKRACPSGYTICRSKVHP
jgi:hypothetical protein